MDALNEILAKLDPRSDTWARDTAAFIRAQATRLAEAEMIAREARRALRLKQPHLEHASLTLIERFLAEAKA